MPSSDITLCATATCPRGLQCRRNPLVTPPKALWQSWANFTPPEGGDCEEFWLWRKPKPVEREIPHED